MTSPFDPPSAALALDSPRVARSTRTEMEYLDAYKSFFSSPKWGMNWLLLGVCALIPIVGVIVLSGYNATVVARRHVHGEVVPQEFDFSGFGTLLGRGIWAFLVSLIAGAALIPVIGAFIGLAFVIGSADGEPPLALLGVGGLVFAAIAVAFGLFMKPVLLRANLRQNVGEAFSWTFAREFVGNVWLEIIVAQLFLFATMIPMVLLGYLMCGLGLYPAIALMNYATAQLDLQLYELHLARGGAAIEVSPQLLEPLKG